MRSSLVGEKSTATSVALVSNVPGSPLGGYICLLRCLEKNLSITVWPETQQKVLGQDSCQEEQDLGRRTRSCQEAEILPGGRDLAISRVRSWPELDLGRWACKSWANWERSWAS